MSEQRFKRQSVREISALFNSENSVPIEAVQNITVNEIRKRNSFKSTPQSSGTNNVNTDSNAVEIRKKPPPIPRSVSFNQHHSSQSNTQNFEQPVPAHRSTVNTIASEVISTDNTMQAEEFAVEVAVDVLAESNMDGHIQINQRSERSEDVEVDENKEQLLNITSQGGDEVKSDTLSENCKNKMVKLSSNSEVRNSVSDIISAIHSRQSTLTKETVSESDSQAVADDKSVIKNEKIISCRLLLKNDKDKCSWTGCYDAFVRHCKENHAYQFSLSASLSVGWANSKLYTNTVSVRIFDGEVFWCYHRVTFDDTPGGMMYWTVLAEGSKEHYYIQLAFYLKGNIFKRMIFEEWCLDSDTDVENAFRCKRCIAIPKSILQLYFGVGESYMDQLYCEATIKKNEKYQFD